MPDWSARVPDLRSLTLRRRVRVELLAGLQWILDRRSPTVRAVYARLPAAWSRRLRGAGAPVHMPGPRAAHVPLDADPDALARTLAHDTPKPSADRAATILILTFGELAHTRLCLASIRAFTDPGTYDVVVSDHGSTDGTVDYLRSLAASWPALRVVERDHNPGFAAGVNACLRETRGDVVVLLNNDTVVTPGWLPGLLGHLGTRADVGLVGPVTNDSGDRATIAVAYDSLGSLVELAARRRRDHAASARPVGKLSLFCAALPRSALEELGGLDERYGLGMFEDDDLCQALRARGRTVLLAEDVFVHHAAGASFRRLSARAYVGWFEVNRTRFERKWAVTWRPVVTPDVAR